MTQLPGRMKRKANEYDCYTVCPSARICPPPKKNEIFTCSTLNIVSPNNKVLPGKSAKMTPEKTSPTKSKILKMLSFRMTVFFLNYKLQFALTNRLLHEYQLLQLFFVGFHDFFFYKLLDFSPLNFFLPPL